MQNALEIQKFFKEEYVDQASYDNLRKISSAVDGLKNSNRKVIHTVLDKNIKELLKVQQLSSKAGEYTDYLHGSLDGVIVTLGQNYVGSNQLPLLTKKGNFGTRSIPEASAARYIFAKGSPILDSLFKKEDREILIHQVFEGIPIEPRYFVPTLPVLLVNGNRGVSSGFSQLIMPRSLKDILETLVLRLSGKIQDFKDFDLKNIHVEGFRGKIYPEGSLDSANYKWILEGSFEVKGKEIHITELPLGTNLMQYINFLDDLKESKKIKDFKDLCDGDSFEFKVTLRPEDLKDLNDEKIIKLLKLRTSITENFTSLGADNKIKEFTRPSDILDYYYSIKLASLRNRKDLLLANLNAKKTLKSEQYRFIEMVVNKTLKMDEMKTGEVISFLEGQDFKKFGEPKDYQYLLRMPVSSMQRDKMELLANEIEGLQKEIDTLKSKSEEQIWMEDIKVLAKDLKGIGYLK